jgi:hypothetical protein
LIDRVEKKPIKSIKNPSFEKMNISQMIPIPGFDSERFPYLLVRDLSHVYLVDIKDGVAC